MSSNIVDKYKVKKKSDLYDYAKILESLITLENNTLWNKKQDFNSYCKGIISYYVDKYYFDNNIKRSNPVEYSTDNINSVLLSIIEYYKSIGKSEFVQEKKNESFLLAVIICTASYVDIASNVVDGSVKDVKNKFKGLLEYLGKTNLLKIYYNDRFTINELFEKLKKNVQEEMRFFNYYKNEDCYNEYKLISIEPNMYEVNFRYNIKGLDEDDEIYIAKIEESFKEKLTNISFELLNILLLKENLMNKKVNNYLIKVPEKMLKKENGLKEINISLFKENIKILLDEFNEEIIANIKKMGFEYVVESEDISKIKDLDNCMVLVTEKFKTENYEKIKDLKVKFITKSLVNEIMDDEKIIGWKGDM
ncbi:MAG: hypothetical protein E7172_05260 [Firmicutes bacterium]|nr:hypothetical protein [Bacillota bacterium]